MRRLGNNINFREVERANRQIKLDSEPEEKPLAPILSLAQKAMARTNTTPIKNQSVPTPPLKLYFKK